MATDTTSAAGIMKRVYSSAEIKDQRNLKPFLWEKLPKAKEKPTGSGLYFAIETSGNVSAGPYTQNEPLRRAQNVRSAQPVVGVKQYAVPVQMSGLVLEVAKKKGPEAFASAVDQATRDALKVLRKVLSQDAYLDGTSVRSLFTSGATSATQSVTNAQMFQENQIIDVWDTTKTTKKYSQRQVDSVDLINNQITLDQSITTVTGDVAVIEQSLDGTVPSDGKSLTGLAAIVDTTTVSSTYLGVSRTANANWRGNVLDSAGVAISGDMLQRASDRRFYVADTEELTILSTPLQRRPYIALGAPLKRFTDDRLDIGYSGMSWNGHRWLVDVDAQRDRIYMMNLNEVEQFLVLDIELDMSGGNSWKWLPGYDATFAFFKFYGNIASRRPNKHLVITNLPVSSF